MQNITPSLEKFFSHFFMFWVKISIFEKIPQKIFCQSLIHAHTTLPDCHVSVSQLFKGVINDMLVRSAPDLKVNVTTVTKVKMFHFPFFFTFFPKN